MKFTAAILALFASGASAFILPSAKAPSVSTPHAMCVCVCVYVGVPVLRPAQTKIRPSQKACLHTSEEKSPCPFHPLARSGKNVPPPPPFSYIHTQNIHTQTIVKGTPFNTVETSDVAVENKALAGMSVFERAMADFNSRYPAVAARGLGPSTKVCVCMCVYFVVGTSHASFKSENLFTSYTRIHTHTHIHRLTG